ncbi:MAG: glycosyltransferase family 39 protein [Actinomycetota bacterium]
MTAVSEAPTREPAAANQNRHQPLIGAAAAVVIAIGVGFYFVTRSDMWLDEALTVNIARLPLGDLGAALERDGAPPLYYALLHLWTGALGDGDLAARSLSGVCGLGLLVAIWFAARRYGDRTMAWTAVVLSAASPYAIRYATEARMYMLEMLLVAIGIVLINRALEQPTMSRLAPMAALSMALVYTQYWAFALLGVVGVCLLYVAWREPAMRGGALRIAGAIMIGSATFLSWLPTFLSQRAHTGTPWGDAVLPGLPIGETFLAFAGEEEQEGWLLLLVLLPILVLGLFGRALDARRVELDVRVQPEIRWLALVGGATLVIATTLNYLADQAFEARYSAIVWPMFVIVIARGVVTLADVRIRMTVLAVIVALGFASGVRNATEQRTQAGEVATALRSLARPGDLIVYCPDQLGPGVHRLLPGGFDQVTFPDLDPPALVNWVDYDERVGAVDPNAFAAAVLARAGAGTLWLVTGPGYPTLGGKCEAISEALAQERSRTAIVNAKEEFFEKPGLQQFAPPIP